VRPDRIILWIARKDIDRLPKAIQDLKRHGLEIREAEDVGPYTKIIPTLRAFPDAFIVTADDDIDYARAWLADLIAAWDGQNRQIVFHRGHAIALDTDGRPLPYREWTFSIPGPSEAANLFPTGVGGVLYPPGSLSRETLDSATFMRLCPRADDIWLYWMGRRAGSTYKKTPGKGDIRIGMDSQDVSLWKENVAAGGNDGSIAALIEAFGWPSIIERTADQLAMQG
jgi:hypothetical protein